MPSPSLDTALVRILIDDQEPRRPEGAGFLVTPTHILTCAHVVNAALRRNEQAADPPAAEIFLDFPLLNDQALLRAKVLHWFPVSEEPAPDRLEDIAVLELCPETPLPAEARPASLVALDNAASLADHRLRMCGFPGGVDQGTYIDGLLKGRTGAGYWEIHPQDKNRPIERGFSGTAVWAVKENAVCGMINSRLRRKPDLENGPVITGYMLPVATLIKAFPELDQHSRPANPYRGLEAFREKDARFYFGREADTNALRKKVTQQPFTAVIGASGSDKSSLVLAGVIPALRRTGNWLIAACRPKKQPFYELAACLVPLLYDDELELIKRTRQCATDLRAGELSLSDLIRRIMQKRGAQRFLLLVDQFEELYTLNADTEARCFIDLLLKAGETELLSAVITMRADFLETALHYGVFAEALKKALIIVPPINEHGLREAVEKPAELFKVGFASGLVDLIIRDVGQEPGNLPLLEFCLTQLWERQEFREINHDAYKAIGGVQQALANHADAVYAEFTEQEQEQLRHIFLRLVRPGQGTEDTRQVASLEQIRAEDRALVTRLADKRLIVTGRDEERGEETVEVVHEALIRRWQTLRQWVYEEREFLVWQEKLRVLLEQWEESGRDEGALLRGLPLDEALRWEKTHAVHLTDEKRELIAASEKLRERERKKREIARRERKKLFSEASYNLAKVYEEKALSSLKKTEEKFDIAECKKVILYAAAALAQKIEHQQNALDSFSMDALFALHVFRAALAELWVSPMHQDIVENIFFGFHGRLLVYTSNAKKNVWDVATGEEVNITGDQVIPDRGTIGTVIRDREMTLPGLGWLAGCDPMVTDTVSPDGNLSASIRSGSVHIRNLRTEEAVTIKHISKIRCISFSPDSKMLASASDDKRLRLWDCVVDEILAAALVTPVDLVYSEYIDLIRVGVRTRTAGNRASWFCGPIPYTLFLHNSKSTPSTTPSSTP